MHTLTRRSLLKSAAVASAAWAVPPLRAAESAGTVTNYLAAHARPDGVTLLRICSVRTGRRLTR